MISFQDIFTCYEVDKYKAIVVKIFQSHGNPPNSSKKDFLSLKEDREEREGTCKLVSK